MRHTAVCVSAALVTFGIATISAAADDRNTCSRWQEESAVTACSRLIDSNASDAGSYNNRGLAYKAKGDYDRAIADFDQAIRLDVKFAAAYNNRGLAYKAKDDYDRAIADFDQAIRLDPKFAAAYSNRCWTYNDRNEYDHAMADCDQAIRLDVKFAAAYNNRGLAYTAKGDYDRAIADFDQAIRLDPKPLFGLYEAVPVRAGVRERAQDARPRGAANVRSACPLPPPSSRRLTNL